MLTYKLLQQEAHNFKILTGVSIKEFEKLNQTIAIIWHEKKKKHLNRPDRQRAIGGGRSHALALPEQLLMTLMCLQLSLTTDALGILFGINKSTASRNMQPIRVILTQQNPQKWPAQQNQRRHLNFQQALHTYPALKTIIDEITENKHKISQVALPHKTWQLISNTQLFQGLTPPELDKVIQAAHLHTIKRHNYFYHQDEIATRFYILIEGQVRLSEVTADGYQILVRFVSPGEAIGIISVLKNSVYPLATQAIEDCQALSWNSTTLKALMEQIPRIAINGIRLISQRWHEVEQRYRELATERVERRVAQTLLRLVRQVGQKASDGILIDLLLTRQDLADMTGTTQYTVSRILSRWEQEHLIKSQQGRVIICKPHGLTQIAEDFVPNIAQ
jgi:CRP-like cAMP-binding protein